MCGSVHSRRVLLFSSFSYPNGNAESGSGLRSIIPGYLQESGQTFVSFLCFLPRFYSVLEGYLILMGLIRKRDHTDKKEFYYKVIV